MEENEMMKEGQTPSSRSSNKANISSLVISSMMLAVTIVLKFITEMIPFANLPMGGSVSLNLVPLTLTALYCGPIWGLVVSLLYSIFNFLYDGVVTWTPNTSAVFVTLLLDYFVAYGVIAIASLFRKQFYQKKVWAPFAAMSLAGVLRLISRFFSGVIVWNNLWDYEGALTPDFSPAGLIYSISYNGGYMLPTILLSLVVLAYLLPALYTTFNLTFIKTLYPKSLAEHPETIKENPIPNYSKLAVVFAGLTAVIAIFSTIPALKVDWLGYVTIMMVLGIGTYLVYHFVKAKTSDLSMMMYFIIIAILVVALTLSILGILSRFTYGASIYVPAE